jgi:hypothetical protein
VDLLRMLVPRRRHCSHGQPKFVRKDRVRNDAAEVFVALRSRCRSKNGLGCPGICWPTARRVEPWKDIRVILQVARSE